MVISLKNHASEVGKPDASLRYIAAWNAAGVSAADARAAVRALLARVGLDPHHRSSQDAQLVVSELVTNAARHAPGPAALEFELTPDGDLLRISVRDSSPRLPQPRERDGGRIGGHGLYLISQLCDQLHTIALDAGKKIVAHLHLESPPRAAVACLRQN